MRSILWIIKIPQRFNFTSTSNRHRDHHLFPSPPTDLGSALPFRKALTNQGVRATKPNPYTYNALNYCLLLHLLMSTNRWFMRPKRLNKPKWKQKAAISQDSVQHETPRQRTIDRGKTGWRRYSREEPAYHGADVWCVCVQGRRTAGTAGTVVGGPKAPPPWSKK